MPDRELKAFEKVTLDPGETTTVTVALDQRAFAYWDTQRHAWHAPAGRLRDPGRIVVTGHPPDGAVDLTDDERVRGSAQSAGVAVTAQIGERLHSELGRRRVEEAAHRSHAIIGSSPTRVEVVEGGPEPPNDLGAVGAVADDLREREGGQLGEGVGDEADPSGAVVACVPTGGIGAVDDRAEQVGDAIEHLDGGGRVVHRG